MYQYYRNGDEDNVKIVDDNIMMADDDKVWYVNT